MAGYGKTKVMVSRGIAKDVLSKGIVNPCGMCMVRVSGGLVLCV